MRSRIIIAVVAIVALTCGVVTSPALAAKRKVPFGFMGTVLDPFVSFPISQTTMDDQMGLMARSGVESVRSNVYWSATEPSPGVYDWTQADKLVLGAPSTASRCCRSSSSPRPGSRPTRRPTAHTCRRTLTCTGSS